jgi:group I intron endonuclease
MSIIGIYKIISPINKIYIGKSIDCVKRKSFYKRLACKNQIRLFNSIKKYGWDKHKFEILCQCSESELNNYEIYYIALFQCFDNKYGLNLRSGGEGGKHSGETKQKMRKMKLGTKHKPETIIRMKNSHKGNKYSVGRKHSIETLKKMSDSHLGKKYAWMSDSCGSKNHAAKKIIDINTKVIYETVTEAAIKNNFKISTLSAMLIGQNKNKTNLRYYECNKNSD